ncbi:hypothetical protein BGX21_010819 [Mortierella sp. AD011]|nr:hypothetical protein BGX20_005547 [Mortierella sp. AD010]KAF9402233.1 hypothetical protein BGX21_010819 [Mortierella sp. AD011]
MRFTILASVGTLLSLASVIKAQDANCSAVLNDYSPTSSGSYQKCFTDQVYSTALVAAGGNPNYTEVIDQVCGKSACSHNTLQSALSKYMTACNASIIADATNSGGSVLQLGKNALEVYFAEPIRDSYCAVDPSVPVPTAPAVVTPAYCLASSVSNPTSRFVTNLAIYLTSGTIRSTQSPFISTNQLDPTDVCSKCSQIAMNSTVNYLADNLMPNVANFYTPEFVQYWTNFVPAYNTLCKTSFTQTWPKGTLNETVPGVPTGNPSPPSTALPTANATTATTTPSPTSNTSSGAAGAMKPAAGVATMFLLVAAALL